jgi:hypothetical protein
MINDLAFLEATDFPSSNEGDFGFNNPTQKFEVTLKDNQGKETKRELIIGKQTNIASGGKGYFAVDASQMQLPFILSEANVNKLMPKKESLLKPEVTPLPLLSPSPTPAIK